MKTLNKFINEKLKINKSVKKQAKDAIIVNSIKDLQKIIYERSNASNELDLTDINVSNINSFKNLFIDIPRRFYIKTIDITGWDTSKATDMSNMFGGCKALTEIKGIEDLNTSNVEFINYMFSTCDSLISLDLSNWDVSNVKNMDSMFYYCINLEDVDLSGWDTSNLNVCRSMFYCCNNLENIYGIEDFNVSEVEILSKMFYACKSLKKLNINNWNVSKCFNISNMFAYCEKLEEIDLSRWDASYIEEAVGAFYGCKTIRKINLSGWDTRSFVNCMEMFSECKNLMTIMGIENFNMKKVRDMDEMFYNCGGLHADLSDWETAEGIYKAKAFYGCKNIKKPKKK